MDCSKPFYWYLCSKIIITHFKYLHIGNTRVDFRYIQWTISHARTCHVCFEIINFTITSILYHDNVDMFICGEAISCVYSLVMIQVYLFILGWGCKFNILLSVFHTFLYYFVFFNLMIILLISKIVQLLHTCQIWFCLKKKPSNFEYVISPTASLAKWASVPLPQIFMNLDGCQGLTLCHWGDCFCMYLIIPKPWQLSPWIHGFNSIIP